jgi:hypothetical protein
MAVFGDATGVRLIVGRGDLKSGLQGGWREGGVATPWTADAPACSLQGTSERRKAMNPDSREELEPSPPIEFGGERPRAHLHHTPEVRQPPLALWIAMAVIFAAVIAAVVFF